MLLRFRCRQRNRRVILLLIFGSSIVHRMFHNSIPLEDWLVQNESRVMEYPISNIQLLGNFNFNVSVERVVEWIQIWSKYFAKISVAGPFSNDTFQRLRESGVDVSFGKADKGFVSPVENLVRGLLHLAPDMDAILYVHDDGLLNLTKFAQGLGHVPTTRFIGTLRHSPNRTYSITIPRQGEPIFEIHGHPKTPTTNTTILLGALPPWGRHELCLKQRLEMVFHHSSTDLKSFGRMTDDGGIQFLFPSFAQADFLMVPKLYANTFIRVAKPHIEHGVFLECAFPTIVLWTLMYHHHHQQIQGHGKIASWHSSGILLDDHAFNLKLCTSWNNNIRGSPVMLEQCLQNPDGYGMFHPVKLSRFKAKNYSKWLDLIQQPTLLTRATIVDEDHKW